MELYPTISKNALADHNKRNEGLPLFSKTGERKVTKRESRIEAGFCSGWQVNLLPAYLTLMFRCIRNEALEFDEQIDDVDEGSSRLQGSPRARQPFSHTISTSVNTRRVVVIGNSFLRGTEGPNRPTPYHTKQTQTIGKSIAILGKRHH